MVLMLIQTLRRHDMLELRILAALLVFMGGGVSAVIAFRKQSFELNLLQLAASTDSDRRELACKIEEGQKAFLLGLTSAQRRMFWAGIGAFMTGAGLNFTLLISDWVQR